LEPRKQTPVNVADAEGPTPSATAEERQQFALHELLGIAELLGRVAASCFLKSSASDMTQDPTLGAPLQALAMPTVASRKRPVNAAASPLCIGVQF
jgi:hypothetical protein